MDKFDTNTSGSGSGRGSEVGGGSTIDYRRVTWERSASRYARQLGGEGKSARVLTTDGVLFRFDRAFDCIISVSSSPSTYIRPRAFTIFCEESRHPEVSPTVALLRRLELRPGGLDVFTRRDPLGTGFICRVDLFDGLRELGVSGTPPKQARR